MVFKRRDKRGWLATFGRALWPRGGWTRAFNYVKHRIRRLPDTPDKICRGIWAGVFVTFTPFYGLHFILAALLAKLMRGNLLAALLGTFVGLPPTFPAIAYVSLETGHIMLGNRPPGGVTGGVLSKFAGFFSDIWHNIKAIFTTEVTNWAQVIDFYESVFLPYLIGGIIPGIVTATIAYAVCHPVITAYQNRRRKLLRAKLAQLQKRGDNIGGEEGM